MKVFKIFIIGYFSFSFLYAQLNESFIIHDIEITGNELLSDENIKFISGLEIGIYINHFNIQNAIKRLWDTKRYIDIQIEIEKNYLNNKLIIFIVEAPFINEIIFNGNNKISNKKLLSEFLLNKGDIINYNDINEGVNNIINYYKEKNYHNIKVDYLIKDTETSYKDIIIKFL